MVYFVPNCIGNGSTEQKHQLQFGIDNQMNNDDSNA